MKKLIIAAAVVCAAVASQAATFKWTTSAKAYGPAVDNLLKTGKFDAGTTSVDYMRNEANNNSVSWSYSLKIMTGMLSDTLTGSVLNYSSNKISESGLKSDVFSLPTEGTKTYSWELVITGTKTESDYIYTYTSDTITGSKEYSSLTAAQIETAAPSSWTITKAAVPPPGPTPEPTSAMLMLLGVAGLALKRKRA